MNWVDLVVMATLALLALVGLRTGILGLAAGIGGLVLGVVLALQYSAPLADGLEDYVDGGMLRQISAFGAIVLATLVFARIAASVVRRLLSYLLIGWIDHVAGAATWVTLGMVALGTLAYLMEGVDNTQIRESVQLSALAPALSRVSVVSSPSPWCFEVRQVSLSTLQTDLQQGRMPQFESTGEGDCTDLKSLVLQFLKGHVPLGQDVETLAGAVGASLTGSIEDLANPAREEQ